MTFEEYLISKKIDSNAFLAAEPSLWKEWSAIFDQVSPASFTAQKLYLINPIRRKYQLKETVSPVVLAASDVKAVARPMMRPKPKMP